MKTFLNIIIGLLIIVNTLFATGLYTYVKNNENLTWGQFKIDVMKNEIIEKIYIKDKSNGNKYEN